MSRLRIAWHLCAITLFAGVWGCAGGGAKRSQIPEPLAQDATRSGFSITELQSGYQKYIGACGGCHMLYAPTAHPADAWPGILDAMQERAKLAADERLIVEHYLVAVAQRKQNTTSP